MLRDKLVMDHNFKLLLIFVIIIGILLIIYMYQEYKTEKFEVGSLTSGINPSYPTAKLSEKPINPSEITSIEDLKKKIEEDLNILTTNQFVENVAPSLQINQKIEELKGRLSNINKKVVEIYQPKPGLVFY